jgi:hypothetical protein
VAAHTAPSHSQRLLLFLALFSVALLLQAGPYVFFPAVLLMSLSAW